MILNSEMNIFFSASDLSPCHRSKAPQDISTNFLQVTLLQTSILVVIRLQSVPPKALFETLQEAIKAAFDWTENKASREKDCANVLNCA